MSNQELSNQLIIRIISNLGFNLNDGLFNPENKIQKKLKLQEEDGSINEYQIFGAECFGDLKLTAMAVNIGKNDEIDLVIIINQDDAFISIRYGKTDSESGYFLVRHENKWVDMTILYQLNLATAIELITQNGYLWLPCKDQGLVYNTISSILSEEQ